MSVHSSNRAPNVSCCDSSHMNVLLLCSDTDLLLAFNSESFVKVRVVVGSANSPHIQFYFWPIGILQRTFASLRGSRTVCTSPADLPRSPTENPQTAEFQFTHAGLCPDCAVLCRNDILRNHFHSDPWRCCQWSVAAQSWMFEGNTVSPC